MRILKQLVTHFSKNDSGFSLAEVMIAAGIVGMISLAITRITTQATKTQRKITSDMTINEAYTHMSTILRNEYNCNKAFSGVRFQINRTPLGNKIVQYNSAGTAATTYAVGSTIGQGAGGVVTFKEAKIIERTVTQAATGSVAGRGNLKLQLTFSRVDESNAARAQKLKDMTFGGRDVVKIISIQVDHDGTNILECNADLADYQEAFCVTALQGEWDGSQCTNIRIKNSTVAGGTSVGVSADKIVATKGMQVGGTLPSTLLTSLTAPTLDLASQGLGVNTPPAGAGNVDLTGLLTVNPGGHSGTTQYAILSPTALQFKPMGTTISATNGSATTSIKLNTNDVTINNETIVEKSLLVRGNTSGGTGYIYGDDTLTISGTGKNATPKIGITSVATNITGNSSSATALDIVTGRIHMSNATLPTAAYPLTVSSYNYVPTMKWVQDYLLEGITSNAAGSSIIGDVIATMAQYVNNEPMEAVSNFICGKLYIKNKSGAYSARTSTTSTGRCEFDTPDTRCDASGVCTQICIGTDCRTAWPIDTRCDYYNNCNWLCVNNQCKSIFPHTTFGYAEYAGDTSHGCTLEAPDAHGYAFCPGNTVSRGLYLNSATWRYEVLCCKHKLQGDNLWFTE